MKKSLKQILSLVMVFCLCLTMLPVMSIQSEAATTINLAWPCQSAYYVTCMYYYQSGSQHSCKYSYTNGMDIAGGGNILAAESGTVETATDLGSTSFGKYVIIKHSNGERTLYAHLNSYSVSAGQTVTKGQVIGVMGSTGNSSGTHLHFEYSGADPWKTFYNQKYRQNIIFEKNVRSNNASYNSDKTVVNTIDSDYKLNGTYYYYSSSGTTCHCTESYAGTYVCTTASAPLTIRSGHDSSYSAIGSIPSGATVQVTKASGTGDGHWAHITYNGVSGYASMKYLGKKESSNHEAVIFSFLTKDIGLNTAAACGVLANIEKESGFRNDVIEYGYTWASGGGYGICQWTNSPRTSSTGRRTNLVNWCNSNGYDYTSLLGQLHYLKYELNTSYYDTYVTSKLLTVENSAQGAYDAAYVWCYYFEVPAGYNTGVSETRGNIARDTYWPRYMTVENNHTTHTYSGSYHEAAHPHKVYQMCSCGATQYTGGTTTVGTCDRCNPVTSTSTYHSVLPFKAYLKGTSTIHPYTTAQLANTSGEIWATDECTITAVYSNGACKVKYPVGSGYKEAYTSLSNFVGNTSASLTKQTVNREIKTYIRATTGSTQYGYTESGDVIYKLGTSGSMTQIFYPTSGGYKLAWVVTSELTEPTYDTRFNPYCGIRGYACVAADFDVYASDRATVTGEIWTTDYCTIHAVYADGWCQVSYPAGSTTKTAYTKLSNFVYNVSANHIQYTANAQIKVYADKALSIDPTWYVSTGDVFYVVSTCNNASQVLYPIDAQFGGGYKLGWIYTSALPKTTYTVSYHANGGTGAPSNQTKTHGVSLKLSATVPARTGYAFVGWATSSSATSAAYAAGSNYSADANLTLYAVWTLNKYEISYNANGGTNAPATQNKAHGTDLVLTTAVPTKNYFITFNANGGSVDADTRQVSCKFLGWATGNAATTATDQPGGKFSTNANTTLYAVWQNPTLGQYGIPYRAGYVFDGWYTAANGGTQVTLSTVVSSNMTVYAHWTVATYSVGYDSDGGTNTPAPQTKTHGQKIALSATVPIREGYVFAGWASEEDPITVQYQPGDLYSADSDIMLIAVWEQAALHKIEVLSGPSKSTYYVGDVLDTTGLTLKATYIDNSTKTISDGFTCNPVTLTSVGTQSITVSYNGQDATFTVTVRELPSGAMEVGSVFGEPGETVTVPVQIFSNPGLIAARLKIAYDSSVMTLAEVKDGNILGEYVFGGDLKANPYIVTWENGLAAADYTKTGTLVYLTFQIAEGAVAGHYPITVSYNEEEVYNKELINVTFTVKQGTVTVEEKETIEPDSPVTKPTLTLKSPALEFKDMIKIIAFYTADHTEDVVEMGMITYNEKVTEWNVETADYVIPGATYDDATGRYFSGSQGIHAKFLGDTVYLACYAKLTDGSYVYTKLAPYSAITYATNQLKNSNDVKVKQLVAAMLNYGASAQLHFGHHVDALANVSLTGEQKALPEAYSTEMVSAVPAVPAGKQGGFTNNQGFTSRRPAVSFEGAFSLNYFFTPSYAPVDGITLYYWTESDYHAANVLTTVNATGSVKLDGTGTQQHRGDIAGIAAKDLSQTVYVAAIYSDGTTTWASGVLGYSIGAYCSSQATKGGTIAGLAQATAVYGYHAKQYFG